MRVIFDLRTGYVDCNVCGSGHTYVRVSRGPEGYEYSRTSKCDGDLTINLGSRQELLDQLAKDSQLPRTREAVRQYRNFERQVARGKWDIRDAEPEPTAENRSNSSWARVAGEAMTNLGTVATASASTILNFGVPVDITEWVVEDQSDDGGECENGSCPICFPNPREDELFA